MRFEEGIKMLSRPSRHHFQHPDRCCHQRDLCNFMEEIFFLVKGFQGLLRSVTSFQRSKPWEYELHAVSAYKCRGSQFNQSQKHIKNSGIFSFQRVSCARILMTTQVTRLGSQHNHDQDKY